MVTRTVDKRGRVALGQDFAGQLVIISDIDDTTVQVTKAAAVPAREAWLYKNPEALASVLAGLEESRKGQVAEGPDLDSDNDWADGGEPGTKGT